MALKFHKYEKMFLKQLFKNKTRYDTEGNKTRDNKSDALFIITMGIIGGFVGWGLSFAIIPLIPWLPWFVISGTFAVAFMVFMGIVLFFNYIEYDLKI